MEGNWYPKSMKLAPAWHQMWHQIVAPEWHQLQEKAEKLGRKQL